MPDQNENVAPPLIGLIQGTHFRELVAELRAWRVSDYIKQLNAAGGKGHVLGFVRGLRLSSRLIYAIREILSDGTLEANWGHIIAEDGDYLSRECDVIIHKRGHVGRWNGDTDKPVMDFRFIDQRNAVCVVSCKSKITTSAVDDNYAVDLKKYVPNVWLFAECCAPTQVEAITRAACGNSGYDKFWHLYTIDNEDIIEENNAGWNDFVGAVEGLKEAP